MIRDPLGAMGRDLAAAGRDLHDLDTTDANEALADAVRDEAPVLTGYLRSTVHPVDDGVYVEAPYAGFAAARNPYDERALARVDVAALVEDEVDQILDRHLHALYL